MASELPQCERCGRTIPKRRRDQSPYCTDRCALDQAQADAESWAMEEADQAQAQGKAVES